MRQGRARLGRQKTKEGKNDNLIPASSSKKTWCISLDCKEMERTEDYSSQVLPQRNRGKDNLYPRAD